MQEHKLGVILFRGGASRQFAAARSTYRVSPRAHLMSRREGSVKGSLITLLIPTCKGVNTAAFARSMPPVQGVAEPPSAIRENEYHFGHGKDKASGTGL